MPVKSCRPPRLRSIRFQMNTNATSGTSHDASDVIQPVSDAP
ncbi:hypothetical protein BamMEX5DRAFT_1566 [Burkholderia ambifaria MEX-5]|uniref:Uncharacterized protein n=1 Tax=Burkholderia ambifaria MEX-5 TaxID=396597 RepID=B1T1A0_9BURK|nr:hypothetical protein BamMEX5DRAFT_1566 [Burkholderia ambifaria MEX-5]